MDEQVISIENGDRITAEAEPFSDGDLSIKIQDAVFGGEPRWLRIAVAGEHDRREAIDDLIHALVEVRDATAQE